MCRTRGARASYQCSGQPHKSIRGPARTRIGRSGRGPGPSPGCTNLTLSECRRRTDREGAWRCLTTRSPPSTCRPSCGSPSSRSPRSARPRGDRRAQRLPGARRRHRHEHVPDARGRPRRAARRRRRHDATSPVPADLRTALAAFARGALLGARGNSGVILSSLVGALCKRLGEAGPDDRSAQVFAEGMALATAGRLRRGRPARRGHDPLRRPGRRRRRGRVGRGPRPPARARDPGGGRRGPRRPWPAPPTSCRCCATPASSTPAVAGCAWCSTPPRPRVTGRAPVATHRRRSAPGAIPVPLPTADDLTAGRPGLRGDVPARRRRRRRSRRCARRWPRSATRWWWSAATACGTSTCTSTTSGAAVEAGIEAGRPHRVRVTHFAEQLERRTTPRRCSAPVAPSSWSPPAQGSATCSCRPAPRSCRAARAGAPSTGQLLEAITSAGAAEVIVLPNDRDSVAAAEAAARTARAGERRPRRGDRDQRAGAGPGRARGARAGPLLRAGRPGDDRGRPARPLGAVTVAARQAMTTAGPCEPGDVLGAIEGDFVRDRRRPVRRWPPRSSSGCSAVVASWSPWSAARTAATWPSGAPTTCGATRPTVDVVVYAGGQQRYPLLIGVE